MIKRSQCKCPCHEFGSNMVHCLPCCEPDNNENSLEELLKEFLNDDIAKKN